jgi:hypothetical protein
VSIDMGAARLEGCRMPGVAQDSRSAEFRGAAFNSRSRRGQRLGATAARNARKCACFTGLNRHRNALPSLRLARALLSSGRFSGRGTSSWRRRIGEIARGEQQRPDSHWSAAIGAAGQDRVRWPVYLRGSPYGYAFADARLHLHPNPPPFTSGWTTNSTRCSGATPVVAG